jgi:hypothetical protein
VFDPLSRCGPALVRERFGALHQKRLPPVDLHHLAIEAAKAFLDLIAQVLPENQRASQRGCDCVARHIVFCRTQAAGQNHQVHARDRLTHRVR